MTKKLLQFDIESVNAFSSLLHDWVDDAISQNTYRNSAIEDQLAEASGALDDIASFVDNAKNAIDDINFDDNPLDESAVAYSLVEKIMNRAVVVDEPSGSYSRAKDEADLRQLSVLKTYLPVMKGIVESLETMRATAMAASDNMLRILEVFDTYENERKEDESVAAFNEQEKELPN